MTEVNKLVPFSPPLRFPLFAPVPLFSRTANGVPNEAPVGFSEESRFFRKRMVQYVENRIPHPDAVHGRLTDSQQIARESSGLEKAAHAGRRRALPANVPVTCPSSMTSWPLISKYRTPVAYWCGFWKVAVSRSVSASNTTTSA